MSEAPQRLRYRHEFLRVARGGKKCAMPGLVLQVRKQQILENKQNQKNIRIGFTVSKKIGNSVTRNRARRRLRSVADIVMQKSAASGNDYVIIGRKSTTKREFCALVKDLENALKMLGKARLDGFSKNEGHAK
jgi:ribonuclease P protein component